MNRRSQNSDRLPGFTLVELLTVIAIIVLLISILIPALGYAKKAANNSATQHVLQVIATGIEQYHGDFSIYPPSTVCTFNGAIPTATTTTPGAHGSVTLAECLEGYLPYANDGAGPIGNPQNPSPPDPTYGFHTNTSGFGTIYGPYVTPDQNILYTPPVNPANPLLSNVRYFVDIWGNEILYYRAVPSKVNGQPRKITQYFGTFASTTSYPDQTFNAVFVKDDNAAALDPSTLSTVIADPTIAPVAHQDRSFWKNLGLSAMNNSVTAGDVLSGRDTYLLLSAGNDGKFFTADDLIPPSK